MACKKQGERAAQRSSRRETIGIQEDRFREVYIRGAPFSSRANVY